MEIPVFIRCLLLTAVRQKPPNFSIFRQINRFFRKSHNLLREIIITQLICFYKTVRFMRKYIRQFKVTLKIQVMISLKNMPLLNLLIMARF